MAKTVLFLAEGFEEIEALTVVDLLRRAGIECVTASISGDASVKGSHDITVMADTTFAKAPIDEADMLILPGGGLGTQNLKACEPLADKLRAFDSAGKLLSAICAAPTVLGELGLLKGRRACCYPGCEDGLVGAEVSTDEVTVDGHITTSRGMGTAIPFGLAIIERFQGAQAAADMAKKIVYRA